MALAPADLSGLDATSPRPQVPHLKTGAVRPSAAHAEGVFKTRPVTDSACGQVVLAVETTTSLPAVACAECLIAHDLDGGLL